MKTSFKLLFHHLKAVYAYENDQFISQRVLFVTVQGTNLSNLSRITGIPRE